ncbi:hypothetical protein IV203_034192 [Nitzschia inconspicua]|uniref:Uncharacterized protein n=1 Tax=Nitzschia inconspicua TaxID=303405 RepID=A0A9K3Q740_9STRA|nr:hypothetical protein IV203_034192 [Nitzschia inconspicua]
MKISAIAIILLYPFGYKVAFGQSFCSDNPFVASRPGFGGGSVDCSAITGEAACWNKPECMYFDASTQIPPECASMPVRWPALGQQVTVDIDPAVKYLCFPPSLSRSALCYDGVMEYGEDEYAVFFGVEAGPEILGIELVLDLTKEMYKGTSVFPLNALAPEPLSACMYKSLGSNIKVAVDKAQDYIVAIRLKKLPDATNVVGDRVRVKLSSLHNVWPSGDGNPVAMPKDHFCPQNWEEAVRTECTADSYGTCMYNFRYIGCSYDELRCRPHYVCDCQESLPNWRCWGGQNPPTCEAGSRTADLVGESCTRGEPLPQDPNAPEVNCPASMMAAFQRRCDPRHPRCEYNFKWFGCFPGELVCLSNGACECNGQWTCTTFEHYCQDTERTRSSLIGTSCDPDECPPEGPVTGRQCTTTKICDYGWTYSGCDYDELSCEPVKTCQCNNGTWRCTMRADRACTKPPGFPEGACNPNAPLSIRPPI